MTRRRWIGYAAAAMFLALVPASAEARPITLAWNANPEPTVAGYVIGYGIQSGIYTTLVDVGNVTTFTLDLPGTQYYLAVRAYNTSGANSAFSAEVADSSLILLANPGDQNNKPGASVSLQLVATGSPVSYSATNLPGGLSLNTSTGRISGTVSAGAAAGSPYFVGATVSNGAGNTTSVQFMWTIAPNGAPSVTSPGNQSNPENATTSLQVAASDPNGDPLTYSATGLPPALMMNSVTGLISGTLTSTSAGVYTVTVTASDGSLSNSTTFMWTVVHVNPLTPRIVWRNKSSGQNVVWLMNGTTLASAAFTPTVADTNWVIKSVQDFDGDGKADLFWRNKVTGENIVWLMDGSTILLWTFLPTVTDLNWDIAGSGDLNGDGRADIVWRNTATGGNIIWLMNGATIASAVVVPTVADLNWQIKAVGDLDGDGRADMLWRHAMTGQNLVWLMNGTTVVMWAFLPQVTDLNWDIIGMGDLNADHRADLLWRNKVTGQNIAWLMNGTTIAASGFLTTLGDLNWELKQVSDLDGGGRVDLIWRNKLTGDNLVWTMDSFTVLASTPLATVADVNWEIVPR
jgi:hypothetical protein